jgi:hypothetical protein
MDIWLEKFSGSVYTRYYGKSSTVSVYVSAIDGLWHIMFHRIDHLVEMMAEYFEQMPQIGFQTKEEAVSMANDLIIAFERFASFL